MDVVDVLVKARALIADEKNWGRHLLWRPIFDGTRAYCAMGAVDCALGETRAARNAPDPEGFGEAVAALSVHIPKSTILSAAAMVGGFNDTHSHAEVLAVFDRAIATERAKRGTEKLIDDALHSPTSEPPPVYTVERVW